MPTPAIPAGFDPPARNAESSPLRRMTVGPKDRTQVLRPAGFEPATLGFEARYSIQLSYERGKGNDRPFPAGFHAHAFRTPDAIGGLGSLAPISGAVALAPAEFTTG